MTGTPPGAADPGASPPPAEASSPSPAANGLLRFAWPLQLAVIVAAALLSSVFHARLPSRLPSEDDYRQVAAHLAAQAQPGDAVLLFPWWTERARLYVPEGLPVVGYAGSDAADLIEHPRIWVLSQPSLPHAEVEAFEAAFLPRREPLGPAQRFGTLELRPYRNGRARGVAFSAAATVERGAASAVYIEHPNGQRIPCPRAGDAWRCPGGGHLYVRTEWHEVAFEPRRCVYLHPPGGPARMVVEFPPTALGDEALLEAGVIWEHAVKKGPGFTPTHVVVEDAQSGKRLADVVLPPGTEGFQRATFRAEGVVTPKLAVQAQSASARQLCVDLRGFAGGLP